MTAAPRDTRFFGHPLGLGVLAGTEMWERFSFYGMQAILMLYMTQHLLTPQVAGQVWGLAAFRGLFGQITDLAFAAQTFGVYSGLLYTTPLLGAWLSDGRLGKTKTVTIGAVLMAAGHLTMASEQLFLVALSLIVIGAGFVIGNMSAQVGALYGPGDERRTRAFAIYLIALNVGALFSPLVVGTLGEKAGWHWGFGAAGIGMVIGLITYLAGRRHLPPDIRIDRTRHPRLTRHEWRSVSGIVIVFVPYILFYTAFQQAYGLMLVWADGAVDHTILSWEVPITWVLFLDGLMTIGGCAIAASIWKRTAARRREPGDIAKIGIGCAIGAAAFLYIALAARLPHVPLLMYVVFYLMIDLAIGWVEPPPTAIVSRNAPAAVSARMMAIFKLAQAIAYFLLGWLGRFFEPLGPVLYWGTMALLPLAGLVLILLFGGAVTRMLDPEVSIADGNLVARQS